MLFHDPNFTIGQPNNKYLISLDVIYASEDVLFLIANLDFPAAGHVRGVP